MVLAPGTANPLEAGQRPVEQSWNKARPDFDWPFEACLFYTWDYSRVSSLLFTPMVKTAH